MYLARGLSSPSAGSARTAQKEAIEESFEGTKSSPEKYQCPPTIQTSIGAQVDHRVGIDCGKLLAVVCSGLSAIFCPTKMDLIRPFQVFTKSSGGNTQDPSWLYPQSMSIDSGAMGPIRLQPDRSLREPKHQIMWASTSPSASYLPLVVFGVHRCGTPWADQGHGCIGNRLEPRLVVLASDNHIHSRTTSHTP